MPTLPTVKSHSVALPLPVRDAQPDSCAGCSCHRAWLSSGLEKDDIAHLEKVVFARRRIARGAMLYKAGDAFHSIYAVRSGCIKTVIAKKGGVEQISGFSLMGDLVGLDGMGKGRYDSSAIALEGTEVCVLPIALIEQLAYELPSFQHRLYAVLSREIAHDHKVMLLLGTMRAEERLAAFLLSLSARYARRGYSASEFSLRMTRKDIGSYLGLTLETVSRLFARFRKEGLLEVDQRNVRIRDHAALKALLSPAAAGAG